jgi:tRNA(Ile)-lysidine synthase
MINLLGRLPIENFYVAVSGGMDSMTLMHFLLKGKRKFTALYFDHGTDHGREARDFVREETARLGVCLEEGRIDFHCVDYSKSREENWRVQRYGFLSKYSDKGVILMAHHLNDAVETYVMSSMKGRPALIPYRNEKYNVIRPFLCTPRAKIEEWAKNNGVKWIEDPSNQDIRYDRNYVRLRMMPMVYHLSPGIMTIVKKKICDRFAEDEKMT